MSQTQRSARQHAAEFLQNLQGQPFPASQKVYIDGTLPGVRVGMREISLSDSPARTAGSAPTPNAPRFCKAS